MNRWLHEWWPLLGAAVLLASIGRVRQVRRPVMTTFRCQCTGVPDYSGAPCGADVTQEDFLCDHCRTVQCPTRTTADLSDVTLCLRLGCPEHTVPGSKPIEVPF